MVSLGQVSHVSHPIVPDSCPRVVPSVPDSYLGQLSQECPKVSHSNTRDTGTP